MDIDLKNLSVEELLCDVRLYASQCTCDELLDALMRCTESDENRKKAIIKILDMQSKMSLSILDSELSLDTILNRFFSNSNYSSIKSNLIKDGVEKDELESRFKMMLLKACTLVVESNKISDEVRCFFEELWIDTDNIYFLNKLKNDLILEFWYFYDVSNNVFAVITETDKLEFWRLKIRFDELVQKRLKNYDRFIWKKNLSWCSAFWDKIYYKFFWDDVVLYEEGDDFIPIDNFCTIDLDLWCPVDGNIDEILADVDLEEMYNNWDRFIVVKSTYKGQFCTSDNSFPCWFVNVYSVNTKKSYRVLSW